MGPRPPSTRGEPAHALEATGRDAAVQAAVDRVRLSAERTRAGLLCGLFAAIVVVGVAEGAVQQSRLSVAPTEVATLLDAVLPLYLVGMAVFEGALWLDADARLRDGRRPSLGLAVAATAVELGAFLAVDLQFTEPGDAGLVLLATFVALSVSRMDARLVMLAAAAAAVAYLVPAWTVRYDAVAASGSLGDTGWTAALLLGLGGAVAVLARTVRDASVRAAAASVRAERAQAAVLASVEETQARVGRELHDGVGSHLTGLSLYARGLVRLAEQERPVSAAALADAADLADDALRQVRALSHGLAPPPITGADLPRALADLATVASKTSGVAVSARGDAADLTAEAAGHLYRIAQEAVANALRHGAPSHVAVRLEAGPPVTLSVSDDGRGGATDGDGLGLRTMRQRAEAAGGSLTISGADPSGTVVRAVLS